MNLKTLIRLSLGILFAVFLTSCDKTPTEPDGGGGDTTSTGKNVVQQVIDALS